MKDKLEKIIILSSFQLKKVRTVLQAWLNVSEMIEDTIKMAQDVCGRRWYFVDGIMETLCFPIVSLIENACPPKLMIEQVERRLDEVKEKIQALDHITIEDMDQLIWQPISLEGRIHIYLCIWHKLAKNEIETYRCDAQLGFESANYPNITELLEIWNRWCDFLGY